MNIITRHGSAEWTGNFKNGHGHISTESGALAHYPYRYASRFEALHGSNPEELIGAAHAACFTMALSRVLQDNGFAAEELQTKADVQLGMQNGSYEITEINLILSARVPGLNSEQITIYAEQAKAGCPVSKALAAVKITLSIND